MRGGGYENVILFEKHLKSLTFTETLLQISFSQTFTQVFISIAAK